MRKENYCRDPNYPCFRNRSKRINCQVLPISNNLTDYESNLMNLGKKEFLEYYMQNYNNFYSQRFKYIDLDKNSVLNHHVYIEHVRSIVKMGKIPHIVYEIHDNETGNIRVGWSSHSPDERMNWYLIRAFSPTLPSDMANIYHEMAKCKSKKHALARFKIKVRYVYPTKGDAQVMEEFLTIYRNRTHTTEGYDLRLNNEYNKIVGDLMKKGLGGSFLKGSLNPTHVDVPPIPLANAVLQGLGMNELQNLFKASIKSIRRRFKTYGYGVREKYDLKDARAFLLKPIIIEGFKKGLTQEEFFDYCNDEGIEIFNQYDFIKDKSNNRGAFFRRILEQIWGTSKHKEARYSVIAEFILSVIDRPNIYPGEAKEKLRESIIFKYDREMERICKSEFQMDFRKKRDEIFKPIVENLALKHYYDRKIRLRIAIGLELCSENDLIEKKVKASSWVDSFIKRNYGLAVGKLPFHLNPNLAKPKSLKEQVYEHMKQNPIARPKDVFELYRDISTIQTIRSYVKMWKKENRDVIYKYPISLVSQYVKEMDLGDEIENLSSEILHDFIKLESPALNMEWKGIIAGAIYLASQILENPISQIVLNKFIGVDDHTISKRYREMARSLDIADY